MEHSKPAGRPGGFKHFFRMVHRNSSKNSKTEFKLSFWFLDKFLSFSTSFWVFNEFLSFFMSFSEKPHKIDVFEVFAEKPLKMFFLWAETELSEFLQKLMIKPFFTQKILIEETFSSNFRFQKKIFLENCTH